MFKSKMYNPLPQFSDSDSDIDIFNAKVPVNRKPDVYRSICQSHRKCYCIFSIFVLAAITLIIILLTVPPRHYQNNNHNHILQNEQPYVKTDCGLIKGNIELYNISNTESFYTFYGIPYAKPPIGSLRWKAPIPLSKNDKDCSSKLYIANKKNLKCYQGPNVGSEDCLYLNVFTPALHSNTLLPVVVSMSGDFNVGDHSEIGYAPDPKLIISMNVVAVSMNYRLNAFGFLTLKELWEDGKSYGNYGIMDQILVLKWIKNNIKNFGGNPDSVTLVDQGEGGTTVFGLLAAPTADGLFHKVITMNVLTNFNVSYEKAAVSNRVFLKNSSCKDLHEETEIKECLYNLSSLEVWENSQWKKSVNDFPTTQEHYGPKIIIDPIVVVKSPNDIVGIKSWKSAAKVSVLIGTKSNIKTETKFSNSSRSWLSFKKFIQDRLDTLPSKLKTSDILSLYNDTEEESSRYSVQNMYENIVTDVLLNCPNNKLLKDISKSPKHSVYRYVINTTGFTTMHQLNIFYDFVSVVFQEFMSTGNLNKFMWLQNQTGIFSVGSNLTLLANDYHHKKCRFFSHYFV